VAIAHQGLPGLKVQLMVGDAHPTRLQTAVVVDLLSFDKAQGERVYEPLSFDRLTMNELLRGVLGSLLVLGPRQPASTGVG
jgi:hypothetical protein